MRLSVNVTKRQQIKCSCPHLEPPLPLNAPWQQLFNGVGSLPPTLTNPHYLKASDYAINRSIYNSDNTYIALCRVGKSSGPMVTLADGKYDIVIWNDLDCTIKQQPFVRFFTPNMTPQPTWDDLINRDESVSFISQSKIAPNTLGHTRIQTTEPTTIAWLLLGFIKVAQ